MTRNQLSNCNRRAFIKALIQHGCFCTDCRVQRPGLKGATSELRGMVTEIKAESGRVQQSSGCGASLSSGTASACCGSSYHVWFELELHLLQGRETFSKLPEHHSIFKKYNFQLFHWLPFGQVSRSLSPDVFVCVRGITVFACYHEMLEGPAIYVVSNCTFSCRRTVFLDTNILTPLLEMEVFRT